MGKTDGLEGDWLKLYFKATAIANVADNAAAAPLTNLYVSLHTADPTDAGSQTTSEAAYTGYARQAVARGAGWTVTGNSVSPAANIDFPVRTDVGSTVYTHFGVGRSSSAAGTLDYSGPIGSDLGPCTAIAAGDVITIPGLAGLAVDDRIAFYAVGSSTLPAGITEGTVYWVKTVSTNDITISTTQGGATLDVTAAGDARAFKVTPLTVSQNGFPRLTTSTVIVED